MKYVGSKCRHFKEIGPLVLKNRRPEQYVVDLFCGGCNFIDKVDGPRIANDIHTYLIQMWEGLTLTYPHVSVLPSNISEEQYKHIREFPYLYPAPLVGFVGFCCSYSGKWWGGYARGEGRNYCAESKRNLLKQIPNLLGVQFFSLPYDMVPIPDDAVIYCDIPYAGTTKYKHDFDHDKFWSWAREKSKVYALYVSEYNAPSDFRLIWSKKVNNSLTRETGSKQGVEKLFVMKEGVSCQIHQTTQPNAAF